MADVTECPLGQSNHIRQKATAYGNAWGNYLKPMVREIVDPAEATITLQRQYTEGGADNGKPMFTGTGVVFDNTAAAIGADFYAGTASTWEAFVRPPAAIDTARLLDWPNWPLSDRGSAIITYLTALSAGVKSSMTYSLTKHSEYDAQGLSLHGFAERDYRFIEFGHRRFIGAVRTALGRTAAQMPALLYAPIPFSNATNDGQNACMRAFQALAADRAFNARIVVWQTMDCTWNGDGGGPTEYQSHGSNQDIWLLARRGALGIAAAMGSGWAPTTNTPSAWRGPRIAHVQWINSQTLDVHIEHDCGDTLVLPGDPLAGWRVEYAGAAVAISAVVLQDPRRLRLTLATPCARAAATRVFYNWGNARTFPAGAIYDDAAIWQTRALPVAISGDDRIDGALCRTGWAGVVASLAPPRAGSILPIPA